MLLKKLIFSGRSWLGTQAAGGFKTHIIEMLRDKVTPLLTQEGRMLVVVLNDEIGELGEKTLFKKWEISDGEKVMILHLTENEAETVPLTYFTQKYQNEYEIIWFLCRSREIPNYFVQLCGIFELNSAEQNYESVRDSALLIGETHTKTIVRL